MSVSKKQQLEVVYRYILDLPEDEVHSRKAMLNVCKMGIDAIAEMEKQHEDREPIPSYTVEVVCTECGKKGTMEVMEWAIRKFTGLEPE